MLNLLRMTFFSAAAVSLFAALMVTASMFIAERAPHSSQFWIITIVVSLIFALVGFLLLGIGRQLVAIGLLSQSMANDDGARLSSYWRRLAVHMLPGGMLVLLFLLLVTYAILARIDQGFAVFG